MTSEEQRIAIANWLGWRLVRFEGEDDPSWRTPDGADTIHGPPDFCNDLNAIGAVLMDKVVGDEKLEKGFIKELNAILDSHADDESWCVFEYETAQINATAAQRAEALCRTLWPERWAK